MTHYDDCRFALPHQPSVKRHVEPERPVALFSHPTLEPLFTLNERRGSEYKISSNGT